jgi:Rhodopirellula transposase DDE domain
MRKSKTLKIVEDRNGQFEHISDLKTEFISRNWPILSIDTKKKEMLGNFYRDGKLQTKELIEVNDHDFPSFTEGVVIAHGIFDLQKNKCFLTLGTSKDTAESVADNLV